MTQREITRLQVINQTIDAVTTLREAAVLPGSPRSAVLLNYIISIDAKSRPKPGPGLNLFNWGDNNCSAL
mgnify:CR=1 FL=1